MIAGEPRRADDLARWDRRYLTRERAEPAGASASFPEPPAALRRLATLLPERGRAVDLAGGDGGGARFLARRGLEPIVVDGSSVALERATAFAASDGFELGTRQVDLARTRLATVLEVVGQPTPSVITCFNYLDRSLLASIAGDLPSGTRFIVAVATTTNLERNRRPPERFLLRPGELPALVVGPGPSPVRVLHRREGWADGRHLAELAVEAR